MFAAISNLLHIPYNWLTKLIYLAIIIAMWQYFVGPVQADLTTIINYWFNLTLFVLLPESSIIKIEQLMLFAFTFKIALWIFNPDHHGLPSQSSR